MIRSTNGILSGENQTGTRLISNWQEEERSRKKENKTKGVNQIYKLMLSHFMRNYYCCIIPEPVAPKKQILELWLKKKKIEKKIVHEQKETESRKQITEILCVRFMSSWLKIRCLYPAQRKKKLSLKSGEREASFHLPLLPYSDTEGKIQ